MNLKKSTLSYFGLILLIILSENFMYLVDLNIKFLGVNLKDFCLIISILWIIGVSLYYKKPNGVHFRFKWLILFTILLAFLSAFQSYRLYGQEIILGISPQRDFLIFAISYFPIRLLMVNNIVTYEKLEKLVYKIGIIELILYFTQYLIGNYFQFLYVLSSSAYSSNSTNRYYFGTIFICLLIFICLDNIFHRKKILKNSILIVAGLLEIIIVGKMRMNFISVVCAISIGILLWKKGKALKLLFITAGIASFLILLYNSEVIQSILPTLQHKTKFDTLAIREIGRNFYLETLFQHPILGGGYINTTYKPAYNAARIADGILWVDNGIFGLGFLYGGIGLLWMFLFFAKMYKYSYKALKKGKYIFFIMPLYWIIGGISEAHWYYTNFLVMIILICMLEKYLDINKYTYF